MKHTPGPWYAASTGTDQGLIISEETGKSIAVVYDKKDACLIAAAPDLLEACQHFMKCIACDGTRCAPNAEDFYFAREAIRKATE